MSLNLCIFDEEHFARLYPFSLTRPAFDFRCGISLLQEKVTLRFPGSRLYLFCVDYLTEVVREATPGVSANQLPSEPCLFINGRFILREKLPAPGSQNMVWKKTVKSRQRGSAPPEQTARELARPCLPRAMGQYRCRFK